MLNEKLNDIKLDNMGDILLENGEMGLTDDLPQAIRTRLLWTKGEFSLLPDAGIDYMNGAIIENNIRDELTAIDGIVSVDNLSVSLDKVTREQTVRFTAKKQSGGELTWLERIMV
jgi:hypothetical protein